MDSYQQDSEQYGAKQSVADAMFAGRPARVRDAAPRVGASETTVTSCDGHVFVLRRTGGGVPIIMLHDMTATQSAWDPVRGVLSWSNTVCTFDARGHGSSRGTPECAVPTIGLLAADVDAAINACGGERPMVVGHGLGALSILEYLRNYDPQRVSRIVLVDQSPRMLAGPDWRVPLFGAFNAGHALELEAQIRAGFADAWGSLQARGYDAGGRAADHHYVAPRRNLHQLAGASMLALWRSMIGRDYRADLACLPVPLLAILGGDSHLYDAPLLAQWLQDTVPGAQVFRYPKADHAPHAAEPARFARDVAAFAMRRGSCARHDGARDDASVLQRATVIPVAA